MIQRHASAIWQGGLEQGQGSVSTESGALRSQPYGFATRFEDRPGTNPEELVGAAHASCFAMALSKILGEAGFAVEEINASSAVMMDKTDDGYAIERLHLTVEARVPGASEEEFQNAAAAAKANCPVSKLMKAEISMEARLT